MSTDPVAVSDCSTSSVTREDAKTQTNCRLAESSSPPSSLSTTPSHLTSHLTSFLSVENLAVNTCDPNTRRGSNTNDAPPDAKRRRQQEESGVQSVSIPTTACFANPHVTHRQEENRESQSIAIVTSACFADPHVTRRLLNVLCKDSLVDLLVKLSAVSPEAFGIVEKRLEQCAQCRRLMVRNINFTTESADFNHLFSQFGLIEDSTIVRDRETGKSKGFGFVTFKHLQSVRNVLQSSLTLHGRSLQIKLAATTESVGTTTLPTTDTQDDEQHPTKRKLFLRNLSDHTTTETLRSVFKEFGDIEDCVAVMDHSTGKGRGYGFVTFTTATAAAKALRVSQCVIDQQMVFLSYAASSPDTIVKKSPPVKPLVPGVEILPSWNGLIPVYYGNTMPTTHPQQHLSQTFASIPPQKISAAPVSFPPGHFFSGNPFGSSPL